MSNKEQLGPRVPKTLADGYKWTVQRKHDGVYKGRLAQEMEQAMRYQIGMYVSQHPDVVDEVAAEDEDMAQLFIDCAEEWHRDMEQVIRANRDSEVSEADMAELRESVDRLEDITYQMFRDFRDFKQNRSQRSGAPNSPNEGRIASFE